MRSCCVAGSRSDLIEGTFLAVRDDRVRFDLGGDEVAAPLEKLIGVLLASGKGSVVESPTVRVVDTAGSQWSVDEVSIASQDSNASRDQAGLPELRMRSGQQSITLPWHQVVEIRYGGAVLHLGNDPVDSAAEPPLGLSLPPRTGRRVGATHHDGRRLHRTAASDVDRHARPGAHDFSHPPRLSNAAGNRCALARGTCSWSVEVSVRLDDRPAWQSTLGQAAGAKAAGEGALGVEVALGSARRVTLTAQPGGDGSAGDQIRWIRPRLVK